MPPPFNRTGTAAVDVGLLGAVEAGPMSVARVEGRVDDVSLEALLLLREDQTRN